MPDPTPQSRSVRGWVVVNSGGWPFTATFRGLRRESVAAYSQSVAEWTTYKQARRKYGVQVVRCTITTDPPAPKEGAHHV